MPIPKRFKALIGTLSFFQNILEAGQRNGDRAAPHSVGQKIKRGQNSGLGDLSTENGQTSQDFLLAASIPIVTKKFII